jgi:hypothetical protein
MRYLVRKIVLMLVIISFLIMTTGLITALHLLSRKNHQKHDSDHCIICQQLLAIQKGFTIQSEPKIVDIKKFESYVLPYYVTLITRPYLHPFNPRPPPKAL